MMTLLDIIQRQTPPAPWVEGENIPWHEPGFSERMLKQHLSQGHDAASRRSDKIDQQVAWIERELLSGPPRRILELTCGPGLYTSRLARLGHQCVGIDYAPAAIAYAQECARTEGLACTYVFEDVREAEYGDGFGLVMMVFCQFNVFRRDQARRILEKAHAALAPGGSLLLEPQRFDSVKDEGEKSPSWWSVPGGLDVFSDRPHVCLEEHSWCEESRTCTVRYFVIDAETGGVTRHALSAEAYADAELRALLTDTGFVDVELFPSLLGCEDESQRHSLVIVGRKPLGSVKTCEQ